MKIPNHETWVMTHSEPRRRSVLQAVCVSICLALLGCHQADEPLDWAEVNQLIQDDFPGVPSVTPAELTEALAKDRPVVLLDAREPEEFDVSHLPGAERVTSAADAVALLRTAGPEALVVAYCSVGYRSAALVEELLAQGVTSAVNLEGSIFAWANAGLPVHRGGAEVDEVHPFDDSWGTLLDRRYWAFEPSVAIP